MLFTCAVKTAIHLELVDSVSGDILICVKFCVHVRYCQEFHVCLWDYSELLSTWWTSMESYPSSLPLVGTGWESMIRLANKGFRKEIGRKFISFIEFFFNWDGVLLVSLDFLFGTVCSIWRYLPQPFFIAQKFMTKAIIDDNHVKCCLQSLSQGGNAKLKYLQYFDIFFEFKLSPKSISLQGFIWKERHSSWRPCCDQRY